MGPEFVDTAVNAAIQVFMWVGFLATVWALIRPYFKQRRLVEELPSRSDIAGMAQSIVKDLVTELPSRLNERDKLELQTAQTELARLREAREWVLMGVVMNGWVHPCHRSNDPKREAQKVYAYVLLNINTGAVKAAPEGYRVLTFRVNEKQAIETSLGAPRWSFIKDDEYSLLMLDVVYKWQR